MARVATLISSPATKIMDELDIARKELPSDGKHHGIIAEVLAGKTKDAKGTERKTLTLFIQLGVTDSEGQRFVVPRKYTFPGRGATQLREDVTAFRGGKAPTKQEFKKFQPAAEFLNKRCEVTVSHASEKGKGTVARATAIEPASQDNTLEVLNYVPQPKENS